MWANTISFPVIKKDKMIDIRNGVILAFTPSKVPGYIEEFIDNFKAQWPLRFQTNGFLAFNYESKTNTIKISARIDSTERFFDDIGAEITIPIHTIHHYKASSKGLACDKVHRLFHMLIAISIKQQEKQGKI